MIRGMGEQNFPQYIHLDGRDFFYLTRRPLLPGRDLTPLATPRRARRRDVAHEGPAAARLSVRARDDHAARPR